MNETRCRLYLITPPLVALPAFSTVLADTLDAGDVACVQLRLKGIADDEIRRAAHALRPIVQDRDVAFILNDRPDLAAETGCDGVHIGQEDASYAEARRILGDDAIVGVTCHNSLDLAKRAAESGADYVAFGAFYPTTTKDPKTQADLDTLHWWATFMTVPCVAIGGITAGNAAPLIAAGADFIAVSSWVWNHADGPAAAVRALNHVIDATPRDETPRDKTPRDKP
ncbi:MAG: thiamine phosphate synthase [Alphaproteobacteria bacterium]